MIPERKGLSGASGHQYHPEAMLLAFFNSSGAPSGKLDIKRIAHNDLPYGKGPDLPSG
jgi:hypothetical protein